MPPHPHRALALSSRSRHSFRFWPRFKSTSISTLKLTIHTTEPM